MPMKEALPEISLDEQESPISETYSPDKEAEKAIATQEIDTEKTKQVKTPEEATKEEAEEKVELLHTDKAKDLEEVREKIEVMEGPISKEISKDSGIKPPKKKKKTDEFKAKIISKPEPREACGSSSGIGKSIYFPMWFPKRK
jgi:hypothetical protein